MYSRSGHGHPENLYVAYVPGLAHYAGLGLDVVSPAAPTDGEGARSTRGGRPNATAASVTRR